MLKKRKKTNYKPKKTKVLEFPTDKRTISKYFDDTEVIGRTSDGDLMIKMGVKKKRFSNDELSLEMDENSQINYYLLQKDEFRQLVNNAKDPGEYMEGDIIEETLDMEDNLIE